MDSQKGSAFNTLRRFAREEEEEPREAEAHHCELCSEPILPARHRHLLDASSRQVVCACDACALLFQDDRASAFSTSEYKLIPRDARPLRDFRVTEVQWNRLELPINMAFFVRSAPEEETVNEEVRAFYPSPGGATESLLSLDAWAMLVAQNPVLEQMKPDVEALLINRVDEAEEYYLAPIDTCYELVGLIRLHWRGFSGGEEVWAEIDRFFDRL